MLWKLLRRARRRLSAFLRALPFSSETLGPPRGLIETYSIWSDSAATRSRHRESWQVSAPREIVRHLPRTIESADCESFRPLQRQVHPAAQVVRIADARLLNLCVITPDDYILRNLSMHKDAGLEEFDWMLSALKLPRVNRLHGNLTVVGETYASSYYHWLFQAIGRLCYVKKKFPLEQIAHFGVSHMSAGFQRDTLRLMGIPDNKLVPLTASSHLAPDTIVVSAWTGSFDPTIAEFLRDTFLPHLVTSAQPGPKRIYVSRRRCHSRHILNEEEVLEAIGRCGFQTVFCEDLSFMEQMALFHGAEAVLAPHGAGLSNIVFCKPGTKVVEIFNDGWRPEIFWQLSEAIGLEHYCLFGNDPGTSARGPSSQHRNIQIPMDDFRRLLRLAGLN